jgi:LysM repeat protein
MSDDSEGRPKPTTRRRRQPRLPASKAGSTTVAPLDGPDESTTGRDMGAAGGAVWPLPAGPAPIEWICPFLRSVDERNALDVPSELPSAGNRCAALEDVVPQSLRQQELVCLTNAHLSCPRYLRGSVGVADTEPARVRPTTRVTPATVAALAILAAAFSASVVFTFARGGLTMPSTTGPICAGASPSAVAVVPSLAPSAGPSVAVSVSPSASPAASQAPAATPTAAPRATATPTASAAAPSATPRSDRYALLKPCPDKPNCWIYRIRSGDNLFSIANYFGVPLAKVRALNPWTASGLRVGRQLILPTPTR